MENFFWEHWLWFFLSFLLGTLLGWLLNRNKVEGDLNVEGEARLRAENDELRAKLNRMEADYAARDGEVDDLKGKLAAAATGAGAATLAAGAAAGDGDDEDSYALEWRNRYLAARVKYLEGRLSEMDAGTATAAAAGAATLTAAKKKTTAKKKPAAKKKTAAKPKAKAGTTTATKAATKTRKKPGPKPGTKRGALNKDGTPRKKPGPKPKAKPAVDPVDKYLPKVRAYHKSAKKDVIANIVSYCGVSLKSRDSALVACTDQKERDRIARGFAKKKLDLNKADADALIEKTCQTMKGTRQKSRVTFYYLMAREAGKLDVFGG